MSVVFNARKLTEKQKKTSNDIPIELPGSSADFPWPDIHCKFGLYSWHAQSLANHRATETRPHRSTRIPWEDFPCPVLCVPQFSVEYQGKREAFNSQLLFTMASTLRQAVDIGLDPEEYAAYGARIDTRKGSIILYAMIVHKVRLYCLLCSQYATHVPLLRYPPQ